MAAKQFVIIGSSFGGLEVAKWALANLKDWKIVIISPSDKFFSVPASVRFVVEPEIIEKGSFSIPGLYGKKYSKDRFEFVHGAATGLDTSRKTVTVSGFNSPVSYDVLVIASGSRTESPAFKLQGSYEKTYDALVDLNAKVKKASTIAIIGGGPTGTELAAEIGDHFKGKKKVTLFSGPLKPLQQILGEGRANKAISRLTNMNAETKLGYVKVIDDHTLELPNGTTQKFDVIIPTNGVIPNTEFFEGTDEKGFIPVDSHLRVKGLKDVYAIGDVITGGYKTIVDIRLYQLPVIQATLKKDILSKGNYKDYKIGAARSTIIATLGRTGGIGLMFGIPAPGFVIYRLKGKDFMLHKAIPDFGP